MRIMTIGPLRAGSALPPERSPDELPTLAWASAAAARRPGAVVSARSGDPLRTTTATRASEQAEVGQLQDSDRARLFALPVLQGSPRPRLQDPQPVLPRRTPHPRAHGRLDEPPAAGAAPEPGHDPSESRTCVRSPPGSASRASSCPPRRTSDPALVPGTRRQRGIRAGAGRSARTIERSPLRPGSAQLARAFGLRVKEAMIQPRLAERPVRGRPVRVGGSSRKRGTKRTAAASDRHRQARRSTPPGEKRGRFRRPRAHARPEPERLTTY
jgi:hypothetical protein